MQGQRGAESGLGETHPHGDQRTGEGRVPSESTVRSCGGDKSTRVTAHCRSWRDRQTATPRSGGPGNADPTLCWEQQKCSTHMNPYVQTHTCTQRLTHAGPCMHTWTHTDTPYPHVQAHTCTYIHTWTHRDIDPYKHMQTHVGTPICTWTYTCTHPCDTHVRTCDCAHVHTDTAMHTS